MNLGVNITGLDKLQRELSEAERALKSLDGTITTLKFTPGDPKSVQNAIRQMERAVDDKIRPYRNNPLVAQMADGLKMAYRKQIRTAKSGEK
jgi:hypothetical protein